MRLSEPEPKGNERFNELFREIMRKESNNPIAQALFIERLFEFTNKMGKSTSQVYAYLIVNGACTAWLLQVHLEMSETTTYRALKKLRRMNLIVPATKELRREVGGPKVTVWALVNTPSEEIAQTLRTHTRSLNPKYRTAEEIAQTVIKDYLERRNLKEISVKEIMAFVREKKMPYRVPDIVLLTSDILKDKGIKVWR